MPDGLDHIRRVDPDSCSRLQCRFRVVCDEISRSKEQGRNSVIARTTRELGEADRCALAKERRSSGDQDRGEVHTPGCRRAKKQG